MPLDTKKYNKFDDIFRSIIDQILFRFVKPWDASGDNVFL